MKKNDIAMNAVRNHVFYISLFRAIFQLYMIRKQIPFVIVNFICNQYIVAAVP